MQSGVPVENEATFCVRIHFCQNASWQGSIQWLEGKKTVFFRSMLEMTILMFSALSGNADTRVLPFPREDFPEGNRPGVKVTGKEDNR